MITNWREIAVEVLSEKIGPVAMLIVNDAAEELGITSPAIDMKTYSGLMAKIARALPSGVNAGEVMHECRTRVAH